MIAAKHRRFVIHGLLFCFVCLCLLTLVGTGTYHPVQAQAATPESTPGTGSATQRSGVAQATETGEENTSPAADRTYSTGESVVLEGVVYTLVGDPPPDSQQSARLISLLIEDGVVLANLELSADAARRYHSARVRVSGRVLNVAVAPQRSGRANGDAAGALQEQATVQVPLLSVSMISVLSGGNPLAIPRDASLGSKPYINLLCRYASSTDTSETLPRNAIANVFHQDARSVNNWYNTISYGQFNLNGSNTVSGWRNLPYNYFSYFDQYGNFAYNGNGLYYLFNECAAAFADEVNFDAYQGINVWTNRDNGFAFGTQDLPVTLPNGTTRNFSITIEPPWVSHATVVHEVGHSIGWWHSSGPASNPPSAGASIYRSGWDVMSDTGWSRSSNGGPCRVRDVNNRCRAQGTISTNLAFSGWADGRVITVERNTTRTVQLDYLSQRQSSALLVNIPLDSVNGNERYFTVEARTNVDPSAYDRSAPPSNITPSVVIHLVDYARFASEDLDGLALVADVDGGSSNGQLNDEGARWEVGETFFDSVTNVRVRVLTQDANGFTVQVSNAGPQQPILTQLTLEGPNEGNLVTEQFNVGGWAIDSDGTTGSGPGVSRVDIYSGNQCSGSLLSSVPMNVSRPDVAAAYELDNSYRQSGFNTSLSASIGQFTFTACMFSTRTNGYRNPVTRNVVVVAVLNDQLAGVRTINSLPASITQNINRTTVDGSDPALSCLTGDGRGYTNSVWFSFYGTGGVVAVNTNGSPFDTVIGVFQRQPGTNNLEARACSDNNSIPFSGETSLTILGTQSGAEYVIIAARPIPTPVNVDTFLTLNVSRVREPAAVIDLPGANTTVLPTTPLSFWGFNNAVGLNAGPGITTVTLHEGSSCAGAPLGSLPQNRNRADVAAAYGLDASYANSGYTGNVTLPRSGAYTFSACAYSPVSGEFLRATRSVTVAETMRLYADTPAEGATVSTTFPTTGWAFDTAAANGAGPGVSRVDVYRGAICDTANPGNRIAQLALTVNRADVAAVFGRDASFNQMGFSGTLQLPLGQQQISFCAVSSAQPGYVARQTRTVNVVGVRLNLDTPTQNQMVNNRFPIIGWAFDASVGANNGPGVDRITAWSNPDCTGTLYADGVLSVSRPDVRNAFSLDNSYTVSGFNIEVPMLPGVRAFTICTHKPGTPANQLSPQLTRTVDVQFAAYLNIDAPAAGASVQTTFGISGWTFDRSGSAGGGLGVTRVDVFAGTQCTGTILQSVVPNIARPGVRDAFGLDNTYTNSGFALSVTPGVTGTFTFTACARSTAASGAEFGYVAAQTRTVNVASPSSFTPTPTPTPSGGGGGCTDGCGVPLTFTVTPTLPSASATATATATALPTVPPTATPSATETVVPTLPPTALPTATETPTATPTDIPSATPTDVPMETPTDVPTDVPTAIPTEVPTATPEPIVGGGGG